LELFYLSWFEITGNHRVPELRQAWPAYRDA
jgi:hypothetical protein